jgi:serine/threonine protein kinase
LRALYCVLSAVKEIHSRGFVHRDIRWPNILQYPSILKKKLTNVIHNNAWFLIDFDDASQVPASKATASHLCNPQHAPELATADTHDYAVDIWSIGRLITHCSIPIEDPEFLALQSRMLSEDPKARPQASEALDIVVKLLNRTDSALPSWNEHVPT